MRAELQKGVTIPEPLLVGARLLARFEEHPEFIPPGGIENLRHNVSEEIMKYIIAAERQKLAI